MEKHENVKRRWLPLLPRYEPIILDSSAIGTEKKCQRAFFWQYVLAKVPKDEKVNLVFGSAYHKFREGLSKAYRSWRAISPSNDYRNFPDSYLLASIKGARECFNRGGGAPPKGARYDWLNESRLIESCSVAYNFWLNERKAGSIEVLESEFPFNFEYASGNRTSIKVDELVSDNGRYRARDFKASVVNPQYYVKQLEPRDQAYRYILGLRRATGKRIDSIMFEQLYNDAPTKANPAGKCEIHTHIIGVTESQLEAWEYNQQKVHDDINRARELDIYPMVDDGYICTKGFGGAPCAYLPLCLANNDNHVYSLLESNYKTHIWDNMEEK